MKRNSEEYEIKRKSLQQEIDEQKLMEKKRHDSNYYMEKPYTVNVPDPTVFSPNCDLENYLRKNLNPSKESLYFGNKIRRETHWNDRENWYEEKPYGNVYRSDFNENRKQINTEEKHRQDNCRREFDTLPIPVLRHSPQHEKNETGEEYEKSELSEEMQLVDDKWKVPAVQKNILKSLQSEGRSINILTQLGSIRRQLQLEQMKLDKIKQTDV